MAEIIRTGEFLSLAASYPVIDVRAPSEYAQGHIPGARNIPLFSDDERKEVGTAYKQINREAAMYIGLEHAGRKLVTLAREGERIAGRKKTLLVHCWRGGVRSRSMVWLFETMGLRCYLLEGGYKSYRRMVREELAGSLDLVVLGGKTGSGKTDILRYLSRQGEQVIDLEGLACHKGSAFGSLGDGEQPTTEQFENDLGGRIMDLDRGKRVWIEDESRNVGRCVLPQELYGQMKTGPLLFLDIPREERARHLVEDYARFEKEDLKSCIQKIEKKLGGDRCREALEYLEQEDYFRTAMITLHYYDKAYMFSLRKNHDSFEALSSRKVDPAFNAERLKAFLDEREKGN